MNECNMHSSAPSLLNAKGPISHSGAACQQKVTGDYITIPKKNLKEA